MRLLQVVRAALETARIEPYGVFEAAGIPRPQLDDPSQRVGHARMIDLFARAVEATGNPNFGLHAARHYHPGANVFDYAGVASSTLADALDRTCRYIGLVHDSARLHVESGPHAVRISFQLGGERRLPRAVGDYMLAVGVVAARHWLGFSGPFPIQAHFSHPPPEDVAPYREYFGAPIHFDQESNAYVFPSVAMQLPLQNADPELVNMLDVQATRMLSERRTTPKLRHRVRELLHHELADGVPTAERIAERLKMSTRTLRRRLSAEGTSHQALLDELRKDLSLGYLEDNGLSLDEIALRLGFSDGTSFHRAFRRWFQKTPAEHQRERRRQREN